MAQKQKLQFRLATSVFKIFAVSFLSLSLASCSTSDLLRSDPEISPTILVNEFKSMSPPVGSKVTVAVYSFTDKTGQRRVEENIASFSTAVTQGAEAFLIKALQDVGKGSWFTVLERTSVNNLIQERQLIRQSRETYQDTTPLRPLLFAGVLIEGGIIGYDANLLTGGAGARFLGIGAQTEYRSDEVTVSLRLVSVNTGEVILSVISTKTILSVAAGTNMFKFFDMGTKLAESEIGITENESVTYSIRSAIEAAVVEMIHEGERKGIWIRKEENSNEQ